MDVYYYRFHHLNIFTIKMSFSQFLYTLRQMTGYDAKSIHFTTGYVNYDTRLIYETVVEF